jgi:predicted DsbA family dithiol-disulfide isomerase
MKAGSYALVDVWLDFICPFSYVQLPVFDQLQAQYGDALKLRWRAFEICPDPAPPIDMDDETLIALCVEKVFPLARERQVELKLPKHKVPRTRKAFMTAFAARDAGKFEELQRAIFRAFFVAGVDIGDTSALLDIAWSCGLDKTDVANLLRSSTLESDVVADIRLAESVGVTGVPFALISRSDGDIQNSASPAVGIHGTAPLQDFKDAIASLFPEGLPRAAAG